MRCYICDCALEEVNFSSDHNTFDPCGYCLAIIEDAVGNFRDKASADEDDFSDDSLTAYLNMWDELLAYEGYDSD